jgi:putative hemolysin
MLVIALAALFWVTLLFFLLESAFESFSRISLSKFLKTLESRRKPDFYLVENYDLIFNSLKTFVFFLQSLLLLGAFKVLDSWLQRPIISAFLVVASFIVVFNLFFYSLAYINREAVLKKLLFLVPLAWWAFYPINRVFALYMKEEGGEDRPGENDEIGEKELEVFFEEGAKEGVLEEEDQEMIESVLEFGDTLVKEIMTPRVDMDYIRSDIALPDLLELIRKKKKSRLPVVADRIDNIEGIILSKDVFRYWGSDRFNLQDILRPPFFIPETMRILELLKEMQKSKQKFAIVIDEFGGVAGVVTMEDIIEEIVGEIQDEYDEDSQQIIREKDHYIVQGDTDIYELGEVLGIPIDDNEDYQTIAGLISFRLGKIPQLGDRVQYDPFILEVLEVQKNRIIKVKVYRAAKKN